MSELRAANRYARAVLEIAEAQKAVDRVSEDFQTIEELMKFRDFLVFLRSPVINKEKKEAVITEILVKRVGNLSMVRPPSCLRLRDQWTRRFTRCRTCGGTVSFRAFATFRLTASSNDVGCSTGKSAGLTPCKILSTKNAARRKTSATLTA